MTPRFTCGTADVGAADAARAGGKAAALGELARAGLPVPRGYAITVAAFGRHLDAVDPSGATRRALGSLPADDLAGIASAAADMRARVAAAPLPPGVAAEITSAYAGLAAGQVAVRSSATMEDSPQASFAGLQDTYLAVRGADAVLDRVRACWASLYNDESVAYRRDLADRIVLLQSRPETVWAARDRAPVAFPRAKASDHVLARFRRVL